MLLDLAPVIPVVVPEDAADAVPLARALVEGGLPVVEITLRTPGRTGRDPGRRPRGARGLVFVGAGTVVREEQAAAAVDAGAGFLVGPGWTKRLLGAARATGVPCLPGVSTASEVVALAEHGVTELKFLPAEAAGGTAYLRALASPLPGGRFCPTGGIDQARAPEYLALPNVACVGGSWMVPPDALRSRDWPGVRALARTAAGLRGA